MAELEPLEMFLLVDYSSLIYRAYHSTPDTVPMHGVHGLCGMLARIVQDRRPERLALCTDEDWRPEFRVRRLPMYKAQRVSDVPDPVLPHEAYGRQLLAAMGLAVVGSPGFEAEDVVATLSRQDGGPVEILSGDRDLFALVEDPRVKVLYPLRGGQLELVDEAWITAKYSIPGRAYGDFALLRGDPSDGLPGVAGIGEKTAASLIRNFSSLEALLDPNRRSGVAGLSLRQAAQLKAAGDYLEAARAVVLPVSDVPVAHFDFRLPGQPRDPAFLEKAESLHGLGNAIARLQSALNP